MAEEDQTISSLKIVPSIAMWPAEPADGPRDGLKPDPLERGRAFFFPHVGEAL